MADASRMVTDGIGEWIAESAGDLAASAADLAARAVDQTTVIDLNAPWFRDNYELLVPIGLILTVATFCMQLVLAAWRRDERALAQAAFGTMTGVLFGFCALSFTAVAITVVDALSGGLFQAANMSVDDAVRRLVMVSQLESMNTLGWAVPALVALGFAIGSFMYWGVMVARKVGILVLVSLAVFAGAGGGWEVAKRWRRGWIEATATLVVSKLLMTVVFLIGVSAMGKADADDGLTALSDALAGIVILAMVLLCPYATYKFVHWASDGGGQDDAHRAGTAGFAAIAGTAKTAATLAVQMHTGSPAPQGPAKIPGAGEGGVVSGIDPSGGTRNEGTDVGTPKPRSTSHHGENSDASSDKSGVLTQPPGVPALAVRSPDVESDGNDTGGGPESSGSTAARLAGTVDPADAVAHPASAPSTDPSASPPPSTGSTGTPHSDPPPTGA
ncbi:ATP-binding protein [Streptomyces sp. B6B3]|uniref:SCO6881 family protein n=1 Tax=Streptomyces sp. B6B3 TaxID=3153570 RepID=UPI00325C8D8A